MRNTFALALLLILAPLQLLAQALPHAPDRAQIAAMLDDLHQQVLPDVGGGTVRLIPANGERLARNATPVRIDHLPDFRGQIVMLEGGLHISDATVAGWSRHTNAPAVTGPLGAEFRPWIAGMEEGNTLLRHPRL